MLTRKTLLILFFFFTAFHLRAQSFEIRTVNEGFGTIGVQVRETSDVPVTSTDFITDIVFGIKWKSRYNVDLTAIPPGNRYNITKSGVRTVKDSFNFQAFYANNTPYQLPEDWTQNTWIEILSISNTLNSTDTGSFEICETNFDITTNPNIGINLTDYTPLVNGEANGVVLPVNLLSFTVAPVNNAIQLSWITASEINSKGFEMQRSADNGVNYTAIGFVNSKNSNSTRTNYDFTDNKAVGGMRYYYRLRQVDINGNVRFSDIKDAMLNRGSNALLKLSPNPAKSMIALLFPNDCATKPVSIKITDEKGSVVDTWKEIMQANKTLTYSISVLTSGQYFLVVEDENNLFYQATFQKL